jgi:uncharacterized protein YecT (DUF1311 family)
VAEARRIRRAYTGAYNYRLPQATIHNNRMSRFRSQPNGVLSAAGTALCAFLFACAPPALAADQPSVGSSELKEFLRVELHDPYGPDDVGTRYSAVAVELHDKIKDIVVYVTGSDWCGSRGCYALLLEPEGHTFRVITHFTFINLPIRVLGTSTKGWHDLTVQARGDGQRPHRVILKFNGQTYPNPSAAYTVYAEDETIGTDLPLVAENGAPLFEPTPARAATMESSAPPAAEAARPSFDCSKARWPVERLICGNAALASADRAMAVLYRQKLAANPGSRAEVKGAQRAFLVRRNQCSDAPCVQRAYDERSEELKSAQK